MGDAKLHEIVKLDLIDVAAKATMPEAQEFFPLLYLYSLMIIELLELMYVFAENLFHTRESKWLECCPVLNRVSCSGDGSRSCFWWMARGIPHDLGSHKVIIHQNLQRLNLGTLRDLCSLHLPGIVRVFL